MKKPRTCELCLGPATPRYRALRETKNGYRHFLGWACANPSCPKHDVLIGADGEPLLGQQKAVAS